MVLLWLLSCRGVEGLAPSPAEFMEALPPLDVEVIAAQGAAPLSVVFRQVNMYGASVDGEPTTVVVNGASQALEWDRLGYAKLALESQGKATFQGVTEFGDVHVLRLNGPTLVSTRDAFSCAGARACRSGRHRPRRHLRFGGVVGVLDLPPHRVLDSGQPMEGLVSRDINLDGLDDVLAWTSDTVFILTGRFGGGLAWGGALQAAGYAVGGVGAGDVSGDAVPDLVVAWAGPSGGLLDVWHGDVAGGYTPTPARELGITPISVSVGTTPAKANVKSPCSRVRGLGALLVRRRRSLHTGRASTNPQACLCHRPRVCCRRPT